MTRNDCHDYTFQHNHGYLALPCDQTITTRQLNLDILLHCYAKYHSFFATWEYVFVYSVYIQLAKPCSVLAKLLFTFMHERNDDSICSWLDCTFFIPCMCMMLYSRHVILFQTTGAREVFVLCTTHEMFPFTNVACFWLYVIIYYRYSKP